MNKISVKVLNPEEVVISQKMAVFAARLTQRGHLIKSMDDLVSLYNADYGNSTVSNLCRLPHPTLQKFGVINVAIVGASRRFLKQITRHQNEVKFMSASLQYSNYANDAEFVVPYDVIESGESSIADYLDGCKYALKTYQDEIASGVPHDAAGYVLPESLRNVLIISATPYQLKHMIAQRTCRRNTKETRYVMLLLWEALFNLSPVLFADAKPFCMVGACKEGKMTCGSPIDSHLTPSQILAADFSLVYGSESPKQLSFDF